MKTPPTKDGLLEDLYKHAVAGTMNKLYLPHSDTYYIREALHERIGVWFTFKQVEKAVRIYTKSLGHAN
jgi:thymidine kinase